MRARSLLLVAFATIISGCASTRVNTALVPAPRLERDSYDWYGRHERILKEGAEMEPEILFVGDSITHFWAGRKSIGGDDASRCWKQYFGEYRTLNIGFGWDRIQNVLWRFDHGELNGLAPKLVVLMIGTNNTMETPNAKDNTAEEIAEGVMTVVARLHDAFPSATIVTMNMLPREAHPDGPLRNKVDAGRVAIAKAAKAETGKWFVFIDIGEKFLLKDNTIPRSLLGDGTHPTENGYKIWAESLRPIIRKVVR